MKKMVKGKSKIKVSSTKNNSNKNKKTVIKKIIVKKTVVKPVVKKPILKKIIIKSKTPSKNNIKIVSPMKKSSASTDKNKLIKKLNPIKSTVKPVVKSVVKPIVKPVVKLIAKPVLKKPFVAPAVTKKIESVKIVQKVVEKPVVKPVVKQTPPPKIIKPVILETQKQYPIMNHNGELMVGTLHEPHQKTDTIVILLHGFLASREHNILKASAIALSRSGYAAYRVDLSGNGDSEGRFEDSTPNKQIQDTGAIVKHFKEKYSKVYLMGHSLGGSVSIAVAAVGGVEAIITVAPPMQKERIDAVLSAQQKDQILSVGFTILKVRKNLVEVPYTLTASFIDEIHSLNPLNLATYVKCPALLIHGTVDQVIPIIDTHDLYAALGSKEKELLMVGGADHNFSNPEHLDVLISGMISWMKKRK